MRYHLLLVLTVVILFAGCATTQQPSSMNQLQIKVAQLENKLEQKDQEIEDLKYQIKDISTQVEESAKAQPSESVESTKSSSSSSVSSNDIIRVAASAIDVQNALKKAGYYDGKVDGKVGERTKSAIAQFQKDHNLKNDGVVGKKTWIELKKYLNQ